MKTRKKKIMMLMIIVTITRELTIAQDTKSSRESSFFIKQRPETRESSNFRPGTLAAAVGFGKRTDHLYSIIKNRPESHLTVLSPVKDTSRRIPIYWLQRHVRRYSGQDINGNEFEVSNKSLIVPSILFNTNRIILLL